MNKTVVAFFSIMTFIAFFPFGVQVAQAAGADIGSFRIIDNSIVSKDIKSKAIQLSDLSPTVREKLEAPGPQGPVGAQGERGPAGPGLTGYYVKTGPEVQVAAGQTVTISHNCATSELLLSGGVQGAGFSVSESYPSSANSWTVSVKGFLEVSIAEVRLICARVG